MLTRRNFLKGLLSSVAAAALVKNGIVQPGQVLAEPKRRVFDMGANTWRREYITSMVTTWDGHIGHFAVWDRLLTRTEIRRLSDWPSPQRAVWHTYEKAVLKTEPVAYWPLSEGCNNDAGWITIARMPSKPNWVGKAQPRGILGPDGIAELWRQA